MSKIEVTALICDKCGKKVLDNGKHDFVTVHIRPQKSDLAGDYHLCPVHAQKLGVFLGASESVGAAAGKPKRTIRRFTAEEDIYLRAHRAQPITETAKALNRTTASVVSRYKTLNAVIDPTRDTNDTAE